MLRHIGLGSEGGFNGGPQVDQDRVVGARRVVDDKHRVRGGSSLAQALVVGDDPQQRAAALAQQLVDDPAGRVVVLWGGHLVPVGSHEQHRGRALRIGIQGVDDHGLYPEPQVVHGFLPGGSRASQQVCRVKNVARTTKCIMILILEVSGC